MLAGARPALPDDVPAETGEQRTHGVDVRLGVLAGGSPEHLREHFEIELQRMNLGPITLRIHADDTYPGGVEIVGVELRER